MTWKCRRTTSFLWMCSNEKCELWRVNATSANDSDSQNSQHSNAPPATTSLNPNNSLESDSWSSDENTRDRPNTSLTADKSSNFPASSVLRWRVARLRPAGYWIFFRRFCGGLKGLSLPNTEPGYTGSSSSDGLWLRLLRGRAGAVPADR